MQVNSFTVSTVRGARRSAAALLIALGGAFVAVAQAQTPPTPPAGGPMMHGHGPHGGGHGFDRMLTRVNASADQRSRIHDIMKSAMTDLRAQRETSRGLRQQQMALFAQPTVNAQAVEALRQQMLQQHDLISRRWTQAMLDVSAVLTPDQRKQMADYMQQRRELMQRQQQERRALEQPKG